MIDLENLLFKLFRILQRSFLVKKLNLGVSTFIFSDYFKGFENLKVIKAIFGKNTTQVLNNLKVDITWFGGYMFVDDFSGHLVVSSRYLKKGNKIDIYLDLIHELFHVKQFLEGKNLFDSKYSYVDRPTEIEAYDYTIKEARRLGLTDKRILRYLETEWITPTALRRLAKTLNVEI
jgi:hypothetical protein